MQLPPRSLVVARGKHHWKVDELFTPGAAPVQVVYHRSYAIGLHTHDFIEVNIVTAGRGSHQLERHVFPVERGDAFVIPQGVRHGYEQHEALDVVHLLLHPGYLTDHLRRLQAVPGFLPLFTVEPFFRAGEGVRHRLRLSSDAITRVDECLQGITHADSSDPADILAAEGYALAAIAMLCRAWTGDRSVADASSARMQAVLVMIDTMEQRYTESLRLDDLAAGSGLGSSSACRLFRSVTGVTPMEHLRQVRIRHAGLLIRSGLPLADVAARTGFCDAAHLARVFRRLSGETPGAWRSGKSAPSR